MKKKIGRPIKTPVSGPRYSLGLKVTAHLKQDLIKAARQSGRTQSQEAEYRLQQSFDRDSWLRDVRAVVAEAIQQSSVRMPEVVAALNDTRDAAIKGAIAGILKHRRSGTPGFDR